MKRSILVLKWLAVFALLWLAQSAVALAAHQVTLLWDANGEADLAGYRIYYKHASHGPPYAGNDLSQPSPIEVPLAALADPDHPAYTVTGLDDAKSYFFVVTAYDDEAPALESGFSNEADTLPPQIVSSPQVTYNAGGIALIQWTTDKPGSSIVEYGPDTGYGSQASDERISTGLTAQELIWSGDVAPGSLVGLILNPNTAQSKTFTIVSNTATTITTDATDGDLTAVAVAGNPFEILKTRHSVTLTGLTTGSTYHFRVTSVDRLGGGAERHPDDLNPSGDSLFVASGGTDLTAPVITAPPTTVGVTSTSARIVWQTDEPGTSEVSFTSGGGWTTVTDDHPATRHSIVLSGLTPDTIHTFSVAAIDPAGNGPTVSGSAAFRTLTADGPDTVPPLVSATPSVLALGDTWATIAWQTDEPAAGTVAFGLTPSYGAGVDQPFYTTDHAVTLSGLQSDRTYHFKVSVTDPSGNTSAPGADFTFDTLAAADTAAPRITSAVTVTGVSAAAATVVWQTDAPATGEVFWGEISGAWAAVALDIRVLGFDAAGYTNAVPGDIGDTVTGATTTDTGTLLAYDNAARRWYVQMDDPDPVTGDLFDQAETVSANGHGGTTAGPAALGTRLAAGGAPGWTDNAFVGGMLNPDLSRRDIYPIRANTGDGLVVDGDITTAAADGALDTEPYAVYDRRSTGGAAAIGHSVTLTGLAAGRTYHLQAAATDLLGNGPNTAPADNNPSAHLSFASATAADTRAPAIGAVAGSAAGDTTAVISWTTDEPATSIVEYGPTDAYGSIKTDGAMVGEHSIVLTGLAAGTTYHFRVSSIDAFENGPAASATDANPSSDRTFATSGTRDTAAPRIISAVTVAAVSDTAALIRWQTDEPGSSVVQYDTSAADWDEYADVRADSNMTADHAVTLTGLLPGTPYHFRVGSTDVSGNGPDTGLENGNPSGEGSFTTLSEPDTRAPALTSAPTVLGITDGEAVIFWTTDEPSNTVVEFGPTAAYGSLRSVATLDTAHSVSLAGLSPATTYHYRVSSTDAFGNGPATSTADNNPSADATFTTLAESDDTAPRFVSAVTVTSITDTGAVVRWTTDEPADSVVQYGTAPAVWNGFAHTRTDPVLELAHAVTLLNLTPSTAYYLRAGGTDGSGNGPATDPADQNPSDVVSFTTAAGSDTAAPQIVSAVQISAITEDSATVQWQTDESGNSIVHYGTVSGNWAAVEAIRILTFAASGYVNADSGDLGDPVVGAATTDSGTLLAFDNDLRRWYVRMDDAGDLFDQAETVSANGHGGTTAGPAAAGTLLTAGGAPGWTPDVFVGATVNPDDTQVNLNAIQKNTADAVMVGQDVTGVAAPGERFLIYDASRQIADDVTGHAIALSGLSPGQIYYLQATSTDAAGNGMDRSAADLNPSVVSAFQTVSADTTAPQISAVGSASVAGTSAAIQWDTDEPANGVVVFGTLDGAWDQVTPDIRVLSFDAGGYVGAGGGDLGQGLSGGAGKIGILLAYDNVQRKWWVQSNNAFASGDGVTMDANAHGGTLAADATLGTRLAAGGTPGWTPNAYVNALVNPDLSQRRFCVVKANTADAVVVDGDISAVAAAGDTYALYDRIASSAVMETAHSLTLTGLDLGTTYNFQVYAIDAFGNGPLTADGDANPCLPQTVTTTLAADTFAPVISNRSSVTTATSAVVSWTTDEPSNSQVHFGPAAAGWGAYDTVVNDPAMVTEHRVNIFGLTAATGYHFRIGSSDAFGNGPVLNNNPTNPSEDAAFSTADSTAADLTAPQISGLSLTALTDGAAVIEWTTDEPSTSQVHYVQQDGPQPNLAWGQYPLSRTDSALGTAHRLVLTGLLVDKDYHYRVGSTDLAGNGPVLRGVAGVNPSVEMTLHTAAAPDATAPEITDIDVTDILSSQAVVEWTTDEPATSLVRYGTAAGTGWSDTASYPLSRSDAALTTTHRVTLTGLDPVMTYHFRVGSVDVSGNGPARNPVAGVNFSADLTFATLAAPDTRSPAFAGRPTIDYAANTIDVVFDEDALRGANQEGNYQFAPALDFLTAGGSDDIVSLVGGRYRLFIDAIPADTILTLTVAGITDQAGNPVTPAGVTINDDDDDGMPDDWEVRHWGTTLQAAAGDADGDGLSNLAEFQRGTDPRNRDTDADGMPDGWEAAYLLSPLDPADRTLDPDGDGWTNFEEYLAGTSPEDTGHFPAATPPQAQEMRPAHGTTAVANDASIYIRVRAVGGINTDAGDGSYDPADLTFTVTVRDPAGTVTESYTRDLRHRADGVLRIVKLDPADADSKVHRFWVAYDRSLETGSIDAVSGAFAFDHRVTVSLSVTDTRSQSAAATATFGIETGTRHDQVATAAAALGAVSIFEFDPERVVPPYEGGLIIPGGILNGAVILYDGAEPRVPRFGPVGAIPPLPAGLASAVGAPVNFQPPTVFSTPVTIFIPLPDGTDPSVLDVFMYDGSQWVLAVHAGGIVAPGGQGWLVPDSRVDHAGSSPPTIEMQVYHFSAVQAAGDPLPPEPGDDDGQDALPDLVAPAITDIGVSSLTENQAVIAWTTDELATSLVHYGTAAGADWSDYSLSVNRAERTKSHSVTLGGLDPGTTYHFRVGAEDLSGNGPDRNPMPGVNPSDDLAFTTLTGPDTDAPSFAGRPQIDYEARTIDVAYDEADLAGADQAQNYQFSPPLFVSTRGVENLGGGVYRLYLDAVGPATILVLTVAGITDAAGNPVAPDAVTINDDDDDGLADDWERDYFGSIGQGPAGDGDQDGLTNLEEFQRGTNPASADTDGDEMPDGWEVLFGLDPLDAADGSADADGDGWTNFEEFLHGTSPRDGAEFPAADPPVVVEMRPADGAEAEPANASLFARVQAVNGLETDPDPSDADPTAVTFTVAVYDPQGERVEIYTRDLDHRADGLLRIVPIDPAGEDGRIRHFWVVYDRSREIGAFDAVSGSFGFAAKVTVDLSVTDSRSQSARASADFQVETAQQHEQAAEEVADLDLQDLSEFDSEVHDPYEEGLTIVSGSQAGAMILWDENEAITPRFGAVGALPALPVAMADAVGMPLNYHPPTVFDTPVAIFIPLPEGTDPSTLSVYLYEGLQWVRAVNPDGTVAEGGQGWMVPGSRVDHAATSPPTIEMRVYHFSAVQAGAVQDRPDPDEDDRQDDGGAATGGAGGGGGCFISVAAEDGARFRPLLAVLALMAVTGAVAWGRRRQGPWERQG